MTTRTIPSVVALAGLLKSIFVSGRFQKTLPIQIVDPKGNKVCEIHKEDPERWVRTNYKDSIACVRWEALAVMEYLDVGYDDGNRFEIDEYEC